MTFVVDDACLRCRFTDCVDVCPVDAFHAGEAMLVIDPEACIDCGVCEPECPADAIRPDTEADPYWLKVNTDLSEHWPVITSREPAPSDAKDWVGVKGKAERWFSDKPARAEAA
jgi:ferredoxin